MEFDVWSNANGALTATTCTHRFADDETPPYGFDTHELRVDAPNARIALATYRRERLAIAHASKVAVVRPAHNARVTR